MATAGNLIKKENFGGSWTQTYSFSYDPSGTTFTKIVCAPVWYARIRAYFGAFGASGIIELRPSYWNGSSWVGAGSFTLDASTPWWNSGKTGYAGHNRNEGNLTIACHSEYPLWKLYFYPHRSHNKNWDGTIWAGGWGVADINYPIGKPIQSIGTNVVSSGNSPILTTSIDDKTIHQKFNKTNRRGSPILASSDHELVWWPY